MGPRDSPLSSSSNNAMQRFAQSDENDQRRYRREADSKAQQMEMEEFYQDQQATPDEHPYNKYTWEVNRINPWLSACDLAGPAPADLQGSCGPPEVPEMSPDACASELRGNGPEAIFDEVINKLQASLRAKKKWIIGVEKSSDRHSEAKELAKERKKNNEDNVDEDGYEVERDRAKPDDGKRAVPEQCLFYLEESHIRDICGDNFGGASPQSFLTPSKNRYWFMSGLRLRHCCEFVAVNALAPGKGGPLENVLNGGPKCVQALDKLLKVDALASELHCVFKKALGRYDCAQQYSVIYNCTDCEEVYRIWTCSALVPYFHHSGPPDLNLTEKDWTRIRPCMSLCQSVEQRCPYMLPGDRAPAYPTQYAGEPTFLCRDPNIPETGEQALRALHSSDERECCYYMCSEDEVGLGICANCTSRELRKIGRERDPPTAPHCDITSIQSDSAGEEKAAEWPVSTDGQDIESDSTSTISPMVGLDQQQQQHQSTSLCGSGGVGSMTSSSSNRVTASYVLPYLCLSSIIIEIFWWSCLLLRSLSRTLVVPIRSVLHSGRGFASFVVVVVVVVVVGSGRSEEDERGRGGREGGAGGGGGREGREREGREGKMRSIEEIRPRSRSGSSCFRWWCSSLSSNNSKLTIYLDKKYKKNKKKEGDDNDNNNNNLEKEEEEKKKKKNKNKKEWYKVWWKRWCCWWMSWRKRRKKKRCREYEGKKRIELFPIVVNVVNVVVVHVVVVVVVVHIVLEIIRSNKMTKKERESRRRPRHRRRRYKLEPRRGRCRWRWKEDKFLFEFSSKKWPKSHSERNVLYFLPFPLSPSLLLIFVQRTRGPHTNDEKNSFIVHTIIIEPTMTTIIHFVQHSHRFSSIPSHSPSLCSQKAKGRGRTL